MFIKIKGLFLLSLIAILCVSCASINDNKESQGKWELLQNNVIERNGNQNSKTKNSPINKTVDSVELKEINEVHKHIAKFWIVPNGCLGVNSCSVKLRLKIDKSGNIIESTIVNKDKMNDPVFKALAESALRAVRDPRCSPLPINLAKYELWKEIIVNFAPVENY